MKTRLAGLLTGVSFATLVLAAGPAAAQGPSIEGVWLMNVTPTNCADGTQIGPAFYSVLTYNVGGTIIEGTGTLMFQPGQRTAGQGTWTRVDGSTFRQRILSVILYGNSPQTTPPLHAGAQVITGNITLVDADNLRSSASFVFFGLDGQAYRTGCSSVAGRRFR